MKEVHHKFAYLSDAGRAFSEQRGPWEDLKKVISNQADSPPLFMGDVWALRYEPASMLVGNAVGGTIHGEHPPAPSTGATYSEGFGRPGSWWRKRRQEPVSRGPLDVSRRVVC